MQIKEQVSLSDFTTFHIGGKADYFVSIASAEQLKSALEFAREKKLPVQILGNGSNVLVSDEGFRGLVIHNQIKGLEIDNSGTVSVGAGENWDNVVKKAIDKNLAGIECLSGIPGSAGGAVVQNIGAYGQTLSDVVTEVETIEVSRGQLRTFTATDCEFVYRGSIFKRNPNKYVVTSFKLTLKPAGEAGVSYIQVKNHFKDKKPNLAELRDFIIQLRAAKGYLIMDGYDKFKTAGSYFKNPVVSKELFEKIKPMFGSIENRFWETPNGVKLAAAFLTQESGFPKGYKEGNVGISPKHSLSLTNFGGGKASEIKALASKIKNVVFEKFGVELEEEIIYI